MLSHDSNIYYFKIIDYVFPSSTTSKKYTGGDNERLVSYLPLSHVAAQIIDIIGSMISGS
jgi:long-subunit acyl-CoA synthetase (AMP-forming)